MTRLGKLIPLRRVDGTASEMSDEALVAACGTGESAALAALFDRYHQLVYRFLGRVVGQDDRERDDLVQASFLEVKRSARAFAGKSSVKTWILGIANNVARHHMRSGSRRRALHLAAAELPGPRAVVRPDEVAERKELLERLSAALRDLPQELREAFVMCELEEVPGVEAARVLDVRQGTLWRRLHDARRRLRSALQGPKG
jgi:RNA polymerase sigma-70 factor (ECF subfamily)